MLQPPHKKYLPYSYSTIPIYDFNFKDIGTSTNETVFELFNSTMQGNLSLPKNTLIGGYYILSSFIKSTPEIAIL